MLLGRETHGLERLIDIEHEARAILAPTTIQSHIDTLLEFPAVAQTCVGQNAFPTHGIEPWEHLGGSHPDHCAMALLDTLAQFNLCLNDIFVAIASLEIAAHSRVTANFAHQAPCRIAVIETAMQFACQHTALPHLAIGAYRQVGCGEAIVIAKEAGRNGLVQLYEPAAIGIEHKVARVIDKGETRRLAVHGQVLTIEQRQHIAGTYL